MITRNDGKTITELRMQKCSSHELEQLSKVDGMSEILAHWEKVYPNQEPGEPDLYFVDGRTHIVGQIKTARVDVHVDVHVDEYYPYESPLVLLKPPGRVLNRIVKSVLRARTYAAVFEPLYNESLREWQDVHAGGDPGWRATWAIRLRFVMDCSRAVLEGIRGWFRGSK